MIPLRVTAIMRGFVEWRLPVHLDGLLAGVVARSLETPPPRSVAECQPVDIPIALEPDGRFHLASSGRPANLLAARREYVHKRAPHEWYTRLCADKVARVDVSAKEDKSWRVAMHGKRFEAVDWWCIGEPERIRVLLRSVIHLGARRRHGVGRVASWEVEPCEPWGDGFPVLRDGVPLRNLPLDYPGLTSGHPSRTLRLTHPYYLHEGAAMLACAP